MNKTETLYFSANSRVVKLGEKWVGEKNKMENGNFILGLGGIWNGVSGIVIQEVKKAVA